MSDDEPDSDKVPSDGKIQRPSWDPLKPGQSGGILFTPWSKRAVIDGAIIEGADIGIGNSGEDTVIKNVQIRNVGGRTRQLEEWRKAKKKKPNDPR